MGGGLRLSCRAEIEAGRGIVKPAGEGEGTADGEGGWRARDAVLLLTRPEPAARRFAAEAEQAVGPFAQVVIAPLQRIVPLGPLPALPPGAALAFTSENGVAMAVAAGLGGQAAGGPRRAYCVGARTAAAARAAGFEARAAEGCADALLAAILADPPPGPIVHLAGRHQRGDLAERLRAAGLPATRIAAYDQQAAEVSDEARAALAGARPVVAPLFSPRSAALLAERMPAAPRAPLLLVFLSPAVAEAWTGPPPLAARVAARPGSADLCHALRGLLGAARREGRGA
jgi:uroporphyrinogen-III synthase